MSSSLQEQLGVASDGAYWDVLGYRLWQSTDPAIVLYVPIRLALGRDDKGRYRAGVNQALRWRGSDYEITGGSAVLGVFDDPTADDIYALQEQWAYVLVNMGYKGGKSPRFLPLPVRDVKLVATPDPAQARVPADHESVAGSRTVVLELTAAGAAAWAEAVREKGPVGGGVRLTYSYPQMMPQATASIRVHGARLFSLLAGMLTRAADGSLTATADEVQSAWSALVKAGAVEIVLVGPAPPGTDAERNELLARLANEARDRLFNLLFTPLADADGDGPPRYTFKWRKASDVGDYSLTITVEGWTWVGASLEERFTALLAPLDGGYVTTTYESVTVPVSLVVDPSASVSNLAASLDFAEGHPPEAPVFSGSGGTQQYFVATARPNALKVNYRAKVSYKPSSWPVVTAEGTATLESGGFRVVLRPETWIRRHMIYMYVRKGNKIVPPADANPADYLALTATYESPDLPQPIRASSRISPQGSVEFSYPVPPGTAPGKATVGVLGVVGGQMVRSPVLTIADGEESIYLLVSDSSVQLVGRQAIVSETDPLAERLRASNARPVVTEGVPARAEDELSIDVPVPEDLVLVPQPTDVSCWAAALAMVVSCRDKASYAPATIADRAGMDINTGYSWDDIRWAVDAWDLVEEGPRSAMPAEWARLLKIWGPIWVVEVGAPYHAVVVGGLKGEATPEGTTVTVYNPWPPNVGAVETKPFLDFDQEFGLGAGARAMLVHARR